MGQKWPWFRTVSLLTVPCTGLGAQQTFSVYLLNNKDLSRPQNLRSYLHALVTILSRNTSARSNGIVLHKLFKQTILSDQLTLIKLSPKRDHLPPPLFPAHSPFSEKNVLGVRSFHSYNIPIEEHSCKLPRES